LKIIGITGGIGSGKSMICKIFTALNVPVFDSDYEAKKLYESITVKNEILEAFGKESYTIESKLNLNYISNLVFENPNKLIALNNIIHPKLQVVFNNWCNKNKSYKYVIKEAAILIESGTYKECEEIVVVTSPLEMRIKNVMKRGNMNRNEVIKRINNQMSDEEKLKFSQHHIINDELKMIIPQVILLHSHFKYS